jgi:integrase
MKKGIYPCKTGFLISTKIKVNGKFKSCTIHGYHSKKEASDDYDRAIAQWKRDHSACYLPLFFEDLQKIYEDDRERNGIGLQTRVNCDKNDFSHMKVWKGMLLKDCLNEDKVINWYNNLIASCSGNIANKVIGRFRDLIRFAWQAKMIDSDTYQTLCGKARHIKEDLHPRKEKIVWTMDEEKKFLNSIEKESSDYIMFSLACYLGCRIGEFLALKVKDYDRKEKKIIFSHQIIEGTGIGKCIDTDSLKTRTSYRIKPLSAQISSLLDYYIDSIAKDSNDYLFTGMDHIKPLSKNAFRRSMKRYCEISGVPFSTPHGLRHTMSTWLGAQCRTVSDVSAAAKMTGNSPTVFLNTYANHVKAEDEERLIKSVANAFDSISSKREKA